MKIDCIGCLHGKTPLLEGGDILIITGDLTASDKIYQFEYFFEWLAAQKYRYKILVGGNHDMHLHQVLRRKFKKEICDFFYLFDSGIEIHYEDKNFNPFGPYILKRSIKIWATPWTSSFKGINPHCTAFTYDDEKEMMQKLSIIPSDVDILISHGPPKGVLDEIRPKQMFFKDMQPNRDKNVGSSSLRDLVYKIKPCYHIFSHIHEQGGRIFSHFWENGKMTSFINCSHVNEFYKPTNDAISFKL